MNMFAKCTISASTAILVATALAPIATADTTLNYFEHDNVQYRVDLGTRGPGPGDQFIFAGDVFDRPGGMFLGTHSGSCTTVTGNETSGQTACNGTFNLAGGQIVVQGVIDTASFIRGDTVPLNIVGGNGIYQNAGGTGTAQVPPEVPDQADANFVLNLTGG